MFAFEECKIVIGTNFTFWKGINMSEDKKKEISDKLSKYAFKIVALIVAAFLIITGIVEVAKDNKADNEPAQTVENTIE